MASWSCAVAVGQSFLDLLTVLGRHRVELVVVGATAAVLEGAPMTTFDLDIVFEGSEENRGRLLAALGELDAVYVDPLRRGIRPNPERLASHRINLFETRAGRLDVMVEVAPGWGWEELIARSRQIDVAGMKVRVLVLEAVIESKEALGREKDRAALPLLRETLRLARGR